MQIYEIEPKHLKYIEKTGQNFKPRKLKDYVYIYTLQENYEFTELYENTENIIKSFIKTKHPRFESYLYFDIVCLRLDFFATEIASSYIFIYIDHSSIRFLCEDMKIIDEFIKKLNEREEEITIGKLLYRFFDFLIADDLQELESTEDDLTELESEVLSNDQIQKNYSGEAIKYSKKLRLIKQYYEQLINIADRISGNENNILDNESLKYFQILSGNLDRLYQTTTGLLEFASEVREAYQMEMDLRANKVMQLFTVIAVIFLPLTLLAGWYGMNLKMPEYSYKYTYVIVIAISIFITGYVIIYFKKRKWF